MYLIEDLRLIYLIILALIIVWLDKRKRKHPGTQKEKMCNMIIIGSIVLCLFLNGVYYIRMYFFAFESPEKAYQYMSEGSVTAVIEGRETDYVWGTGESFILRKDITGWRVPVNDESITGNMIYGGKNLYVDTVRYRYTKECYVTVLDYAGDYTLEITDNYNSLFERVIRVEKDLGKANVYYCAYVYGLGEDYEITIDGETYSLD